jgi:hypothetical protein
VEKP